MDELTLKKDELRRQAISYRKSLGAETKKSFDKKIENKLLNMWQYCETNVILIYTPVSSEINTFGIIGQALRDNKRVFLPKSIVPECSLDFYEIDGTDSLTDGLFGIKEPEAVPSKKLSDFGKGLCVVPGLVFDRQGNRIGYGKGFYDRFLADFKGETVGLCYQENLKEEIAKGEHDVKINTVITENEIINITHEGRHLI